MTLSMKFVYRHGWFVLLEGNPVTGKTFLAVEPADVRQISNSLASAEPRRILVWGSLNAVESGDEMSLSNALRSPLSAPDILPLRHYRSCDIFRRKTTPRIRPQSGPSVMGRLADL
jgi:hypothetical protein